MKQGTDNSLFKVTGLFALVVLALFALHQDFWLRDNSDLLFGLPVGLLYHVGYCLAVSLTFGLFVSARRR
ncbi:MAG: hypothetical protein ACE5GX_13060 [Thermoanaerobaculia bacterium]